MRSWIQRVRGRTLAAAAIAVTSVAIIIGPVTSGGGGSISCDRTAADDSALDTQVDAATSGQVVCITANGTYSTVGTGDNTPITITAQTGVSPLLTASLNNNDGNLTIDGNRETWNDNEGIYSNSIFIAGTPGPDNVTVRDMLIEDVSANGAANFFIDGPSTADILIEHNRFTGVDFGTEASIRVDSSASAVVVNRNLFHDQHGDGVKHGGSTTVTITNNKFMNIDDNSVRSPGADIHSDAIQNNSDNAHTIAIGNWVDNCSQGITSFDKMHSSTYTHNIIQNCGAHSMTLMMDNDGSTHSWNSILGDTGYDCSTSPGKQTQYPGEPASDPAIENNIFIQSPNFGSGDGLCVGTPYNNNMLPSGASGTNFNGSPTYVGGSDPDAFDEFSDFCLVDGTTGEDDATNGTQVGVCGDGFTGGPPSGEGY